MSQDQQNAPFVVVGVDGSPDGMRAVFYAMRAAKLRDAALVLIYAIDDAVLAGAWGVVYDPSMLADSGTKVLAAAAEQLVAAGFPADRIEQRIAMGSPIAALTQAGAGAELLVVGRRSVSGLQRMFVGSTAVGVASLAPCPVVVISRDANPEPTGAKEEIGVAINGTEKSRVTLRLAFEEARRRGTSLRIITVVKPAMSFFGEQPYWRELEQAAMAGVEAQRSAVAPEFPDVTTTVDILHGNAVDCLVAATDQLDLLVVGSRGSGAGFALGGVVRGVLAHATAPVLVVPGA